jgi:polyketide synthase 7
VGAIAIVGAACRFPQATNLREFWGLLTAGTVVTAPMPARRTALIGPSGREGNSPGGYVDDIEMFDADFFGISPREARAMDPRQRLALELTWESLEDAGVTSDGLAAFEVAVYLGAMNDDYAILTQKNPAQTGHHTMAGISRGMIANRVSRFYGFRGPSMVVDSGQSSSLVAVHQACERLRSGESDFALAGAVHLNLSIETLDVEAHFGALSTSGHSRPFDRRADGYVRGEGGAVVLLRRLEDAISAGDRIHAVISGAAVGNAGATGSALTVPASGAQADVVARACADGQIDPATVGYVECHGTATKVGDPIEAAALGVVFGDRRSPLLVGSVKGNIGHLGAASGMAGLLKTMLAVKNSVIPKSVNYTEPNPDIEFEAMGLRVNDAPCVWPVGVRRAGVSSFGMGGTNAHVVVEQAPVVGSGLGGVPGDSAAVVPWVLSAKTAKALSEQAGQLSEFVSGGDELSPVDVGWSLAHRTVFEHRAVVIGRDGDGLAAGLAGLARGEVADGIVFGRARPNVSTVFVFPGQGSHWLGMGAELLESAPVFADCMRRCDSALREFTDWSLIEVIRGAPGSPRLDRVDVVQPALWAVMVSLAELWRSYGVQPDAVIGHSQGEIAAACVAGGLSLRDGARIIAARSRLLKQLSGLGGMVWVGCSESVVHDLILRLVAKIDIAAVNSSVSVVVSGDPAALEDLLRYCESANIRARRIDVDYASHSDQVCDVRADLLAALASIEPVNGSVPFISSATGEVINTSGLDAGYWYDSLRGPVKFGQALETALAQGYLAFVECSPHPVLIADAEQIVADSRGSLDDGIFVPSLGRGDGGLDRFLCSVGQAFTAGIQVDWKSAFDRYCVRWVELPTYPFQHRRFWITPSNGFQTGPDEIGQSRIDHPFLRSMIERPDSTDVVLTGLLSLRRAPWLADHRINGNVIFPGAGFVEMAARAAHVVGCGGIGDVTITEPLQLCDGTDVHVQVVVDAHLATGDRPLRIYSRAAGQGSNWTLHVEGSAGANNQGMDAALQIPGGAEVVDLTDLYQTLYDRGYQYGPAFQALNAMWRYGDDYFAEIALPQGVAPTERGFGVHPIILDAALHVMLIHRCADSVEFPFAWEGVTVRDSVATTLIARISPLPGGAVSIELADVTGQSVLSIRSVRMRALPPGQPGTDVARSADLRRLSWEPVGEIPSTASAFGVPVVYEAYGAGECENLVSSVYELSERGLHHLQEHLRQADSGTLIVVTRGAVALPGERVEDLAGAALWGLFRSAQAEHPGAVILVDIDTDSELVPATIAATGEPQVVVRSGRYHTPKLVPAVGEQELPPPGASWRMRFDGSGVLGKTHFERDSPDGRLSPGQVRVEIHAVGVNFRDVLVSLGMYPDPGVVPGAEAAGLVVEVAPDVTGLAPGDAVMGLIVGVGPVLVADHRLLARIPHGWSMAKAASVPVVFLTAYYALADVIEIERGESVLIHAATGGVGMAALQLARYWGADVFVTAHRSKWELLRSMGFDDSRIGDSRTPDFVTNFRSQTGQRGLDAVLNSLAGEFVDASLDTLREGGRFVEMGKTDIRDTAWLSRKYPGTRYQAIDLFDTPFERIAQMWNELVPMFESGALTPLPRRTWDLRDASEAYRFVGQARHVGKVVLHLPAALRSGTVLISGGTGMAGAAVARHLVSHHGVRRLLLLSRRGMLADDARSLVTELTELGAAVDVKSCDIANHEALQRILDSYKKDHPLSGVVHAAGLLDDATVERMSPEQLRRVLEVKVAGAWNLHDLTADLDLAAFVLFSSVVGTLGRAGQANYAAANAFLDALVERRRFDRLPGISLAWGVWDEPSAMTGHLDDRDAARLRRAGLIPMPTDEALRLFDAAIEGHSGVLVASSFDPAKADAFTQRLSGEPCAPPPRYVDMATGGGVHEQAWRSGTGAADGQAALFDLVCTQVAAVLGYEDPATLEPRMAFRDLGFDSQSAVELRNRLRMATGVTLSATIVFDHPTPEALTRFLAAELQSDVEPVVSGDRLGRAIASVERLLKEGTWTPEQLSEAVSRLRSLVSGVVRPSGNVGGYADIEDASDSELFAMLDEQLGG